jgi:hypothetical protein
MSESGVRLARKLITRNSISRRTGISTSRLNQLAVNAATKLRANEVYLIALAIVVYPCEALKAVGGVNLEK